MSATGGKYAARKFATSPKNRRSGGVMPVPGGNRMRDDAPTECYYDDAEEVTYHRAVAECVERGDDCEDDPEASDDDDDDREEAPSAMINGAPACSPSPVFFNAEIEFVLRLTGDRTEYRLDGAVLADMIINQNSEIGEAMRKDVLGRAHVKLIQARVLSGAQSELSKFDIDVCIHTPSNENCCILTNAFYVLDTSTDDERSVFRRSMPLALALDDFATVYKNRTLRGEMKNPLNYIDLALLADERDVDTGHISHEDATFDTDFGLVKYLDWNLYLKVKLWYCKNQTRSSGLFQKLDRGIVMRIRSMDDGDACCKPRGVVKMNMQIQIETHNSRSGDHRRPFVRSFLRAADDGDDDDEYDDDHHESHSAFTGNNRGDRS
ncbi:hypothetical protein CYMTET_22560 [Cymbomonas tetramitiformis]|uniref:Uncharacterized protein n=1 Tax=Cymbomonas tetramitiformis TaxID=36881 RepID=A0AAE0L1U9_9CHLO|nr:hypothetical protein CYMTET_22560 [Cymbomonas tetramitiformis]